MNKNLRELFKYMAKLRVESCPWCCEESWYGLDHMSSCPITAIKLELKKGA